MCGKKPSQYYKVIILQLKQINNFFKKESNQKNKSHILQLRPMKPNK